MTSREEMKKLWKEYYYSKKPIDIKYPNIKEEIEKNRKTIIKILFFMNHLGF